MTQPQSIDLLAAAEEVRAYRHAITRAVRQGTPMPDLAEEREYLRRIYRAWRVTLIAVIVAGCAPTGPIPGTDSWYSSGANLQGATADELDRLEQETLDAQAAGELPPMATADWEWELEIIRRERARR